MDEHQIEEHKELRDCVVAKFPIVSYHEGGKLQGNLSKISELYDNVQLLVFCEEPWRLLGAQALAINDKLQYALIKCTYKSASDGEILSSEYLLLAEKRIAEFQARAQYTTMRGKKQVAELKTLVLINGAQLQSLVTAHPLLPGKTLPTVVYGGVSVQYGTGVMAVTPGHDLESLKVASHYTHIEKSGVVDQ